MVMALAFDYNNSFTRVATKRKNKVSVGFEWEIPAEIEEGECTCDDNYDPDTDEHYDCPYCCGEEGETVYTDTSTDNYIASHGFRTHVECGGLEFASPVFSNISTARRVANALKVVALQDRALGPDANDNAGCGIHVHSGYTGWNENTLTIDGIPADVYNAYEQITGMLNRKSSSKFVYEFSGRENSNSGYKTQGVSSCWDSTGAVTPSHSQRRYMRSLQMVRPNRFGKIGTVEYRLWDAAEDRLIPAIEFAHACTTFITRRKGIPYIKEFKLWLDKQSGYKVLKQDNALRLI